MLIPSSSSSSSKSESSIKLQSWLTCSSIETWYSPAKNLANLCSEREGGREGEIEKVICQTIHIHTNNSTYLLSLAGGVG